MRKQLVWLTEFLGILLVLGTAISVLLGVLLGRMTGLDPNATPLIGYLLGGVIAWRVSGAPGFRGSTRRRRRPDDTAAAAASLIVLAAMVEHQDTGSDGSGGL
jgi:hypothetical protein